MRKKALVHESELARNEPDSQVHHLPRAYDDGLPRLGHPVEDVTPDRGFSALRLPCGHDVAPLIYMMDRNPPPMLACPLTPIHAPMPKAGQSIIPEP